MGNSKLIIESHEKWPVYDQSKTTLSIMCGIFSDCKLCSLKFVLNTTIKLDQQLIQKKVVVQTGMFLIAKMI